LTPIIDRFVKLDHQFRDEALMVPRYGGMGRRATLERIEPIQFDQRYSFRWLGVEAARNAQQMQQQIAAINVVRGIPPQQYGGREIDLVPAISQMIENAFGPRLAPLIFKEPSQMMPVPADQENMLLAHGFESPVHPMDDDNQHIQVHMMLLQAPGAGGQQKVRQHIFMHMQQQQKKIAMAQMQMQAQMQPQGIPGAPGGGGQPGFPGTPRIGAQPGQPRMQGPPGSMHIDKVGPTSGGMPRMRGAGV
jgi:hypothetical protein